MKNPNQKVEDRWIDGQIAIKPTIQLSDLPHLRKPAEWLRANLVSDREGLSHNLATSYLDDLKQVFKSLLTSIAS